MDFHDFQWAIMLDSPPRRKSRSEFGMGLKTAACWFGKCWSVESVALGSGIKYRTTVDVEALSKYKNEEITVEEIPCSKKEHGTIVTIWNLNRTLSGTQIGKTTPDPTDIEVEGANGKRIVFFCNGEQYIFNFILKKDDPNSRWLNIAMSGDEYIVEWNIRHMFFKPYINDEHFLTIMEQFTFALALSEIEAMRLSVDGKIDPSSIRMKMNDTLKAVITEGH